VLLGARCGQAEADARNVHRDTNGLGGMELMALRLLGLEGEPQEAGHTLDGLDFHLAAGPRLVAERHWALVVCIQLDVHAHGDLVVVHLAATGPRWRGRGCGGCVASGK